MASATAGVGVTEKWKGFSRGAVGRLSGRLRSSLRKKSGADEREKDDAAVDTLTPQSTIREEGVPGDHLQGSKSSLKTSLLKQRSGTTNSSVSENDASGSNIDDQNTFAAPAGLNTNQSSVLHPCKQQEAGKSSTMDDRKHSLEHITDGVDHPQRKADKVIPSSTDKKHSESAGPQSDEQNGKEDSAILSTIHEGDDQDKIVIPQEPIVDSGKQEEKKGTFLTSSRRQLVRLSFRRRGKSGSFRGKKCESPATEKVVGVSTSSPSDPIQDADKSNHGSEQASAGRVRSSAVPVARVEEQTVDTGKIVDRPQYPHSAEAASRTSKPTTEEHTRNGENQILEFAPSESKIQEGTRNVESSTQQSKEASGQKSGKLLRSGQMQLLRFPSFRRSVRGGKSSSSKTKTDIANAPETLSSTVVHTTHVAKENDNNRAVESPSDTAKEQPPASPVKSSESEEKSRSVSDSHLQTAVQSAPSGSLKVEVGVEENRDDLVTDERQEGDPRLPESGLQRHWSGGRFFQSGRRNLPQFSSFGLGRKRTPKSPTKNKDGVMKEIQESSQSLHASSSGLHALKKDETSQKKSAMRSAVKGIPKRMPSLRRKDKTTPDAKNEDVTTSTVSPSGRRTVVPARGPDTSKASPYSSLKEVGLSIGLPLGTSTPIGTPMPPKPVAPPISSPPTPIKSPPSRSLSKADVSEISSAKKMLSSRLKTMSSESTNASEPSHEDKAEKKGVKKREVEEELVVKESLESAKAGQTSPPKRYVPLPKPGKSPSRSESNIRVTDISLIRKAKRRLSFSQNNLSEDSVDVPGGDEAGNKPEEKREGGRELVLKQLSESAHARKASQPASSVPPSKPEKSPSRSLSNVRVSLDRSLIGKAKKKLSYSQKNLSEGNVDDTQTSRDHFDIAPTTESQARAKYYSHGGSTGRLTREWRSTIADLERSVDTAAATSLSDGLWYSTSHLHQKKASYLRMNRSLPSSLLTNCCPGCETPFTSSSPSKINFKKAVKANHCIMCSGVYCKKCLRFPRRLNKQGNHDPGGQEYKVCKNCHEPRMSQVSRVTELGVVRSHTKDFNRYRDEFRAYQWDIEKAHEEYRFEPTYYSILRQCRRLKEGFRQSLNFRSSVSALSIRKGPTPEWQKARTWVDANNKDVPGCQLCPRNPAKFVPGSLHNCRTCGRRVCNQDSSQDLLLFLPDVGSVNHSIPRTPECKLIRIAGCPSAEPSTHLYLRICSTCKTKLTVLQERHFTCTVDVTQREYQRCVEGMERIHLDTKRMKEKIQERMPQFADMVGELVSDSKNLPEAVRKALAYHQGNLIDQFPQYLATVSKLRDLSPQTDQQLKLVRHLKQEKFAFYQQSSAEFQGMVRRMMNIMPKDEIEQIKITIDTEAINCACLVLKQLAMEVLNISKKHKLFQDLAKTIIDVYTLCEEDLKQVLSRNPAETESWESHLETITKYVKAEMQEGRRLIYLDKKRENVSLEVFLRKECARKIQGIVIHIQLKSSSQSFKKSKEALERLQEEWS